MLPKAKTSFSLLPPDTEVSLLLGSSPDEQMTLVSGTLQDLARALTPLISAEAMKIEVSRFAPKPSDLVVMTFGAGWQPRHSEILNWFWSDHFPGVPLMILAEDDRVEVLTSNTDGLRTLAKALHPVLAEIAAEGGLG